MTPEDVLSRLCQLFPQFDEYWYSEDNCHLDESGATTHCGVFAQFSYFLRETLAGMSPTALKGLREFVEQCMETPGSELDDAVGACLLENIAGEEFTDRLKQHLGNRARASLAQSEGPI